MTKYDPKIEKAFTAAGLPTDAQADAALLAVELEDAIVGFVRGLRGPRQNPVTTKQIATYIRRWPMFAEVTDDQISDAQVECISMDRIRCVPMTCRTRRWNCRYGYEVS